MVAMIDDVKDAGETPSFRVTPDLHGGFTGWKWPKHHNGPLVTPGDKAKSSGKKGTKKPASKKAPAKRKGRN